jgi:predicted DNA-binding protein
MLETGVKIMVKIRRAISIDEEVEERLTKLSREQGISRSFFCNKAIIKRLKKLGLW